MMDCGRAQDVLLAVPDGIEIAAEEHEEALRHVSDCTACREFSQFQHALDAALETAILRPVLSSTFRHDLREAIRAPAPVSANEWLPDIAYVTGAAAGIAPLMAIGFLGGTTTILVVAIVILLGYVFQIALTYTWQHLDDALE